VARRRQRLKPTQRTDDAHDVGRERIGLIGAFAFSLVCATALSWVNGDWGLLSTAGRQLLRPDALRVYVDTPGLQAGPPALLIIGVIAKAGNVAGPALVHASLWLIGIAIAVLAIRTSRVGKAATDSAEATDRVEVPVTVMALVAALPVFSYLLSDGVIAPTLALALTISVLGLLWLRRSGGDTSARSVSMTRGVWIALLAVGPWSALASLWTHLDDGLALLAMAAALCASARGHRWATSIGVGAAIAFKPWAIASLPLLWRPGDRRGSALDLARALCIPAACWLPFVLSARGTLGAASRPFPISGFSTLYWLGLHDATAPPWLRTAQLVMILLCAALALHRSPADALAVGLVARLAFDPSVVDYYAAGAIALIAVADIVNRRPAWRTCLAIVGLWLGPFLADPVLKLGLLRTVTLGVLLAAGISPSWSRLPLRESLRGFRPSGRPTIPA
jgi:hypothetical protein